MHYDVFSSFYDRLTENVDYESIAQFIASFVSKGAIAVDLGCGTGRLCRILAQKGYNMIGVDRSEGMLEEAYSSADNSGILYLCQDLCELDLYGSIKGAVCVLDTLNHLASLEDVAAVIKKVGLFMEKDGIFIFDVNTEYKHKKILSDNAFVYDYEDLYCVWQNELQENNGAIDVYLDFFIPVETEDGEEIYARSSESFTEILIPTDEIKKMLDDADFELLTIKDDYTDNDPCETTQRLTFVARKKVDQ